MENDDVEVTIQELEQIEPLERIEQIDGLCFIRWITLIFQTSILKTTMTMNQYWSHGKIQCWNNPHRTNGKRQSFVFQQWITPQQSRIEHLLLKKRQKINMKQHRFQWVQPTASPIISRRLQLHKMTQWLMCKLIQLKQVLIENQPQTLLLIGDWWKISMIKIEIIICQTNDQQQFHQFDEFQVHYLQPIWHLDYIMTIFQFQHEIPQEL